LVRGKRHLLGDKKKSGITIPPFKLGEGRKGKPAKENPRRYLQKRYREVSRGRLWGRRTGTAAPYI